jgi:tetratricopeptide (TPR) repeat protein
LCKFVDFFPPIMKRVTFLLALLCFFIAALPVCAQDAWVGVRSKNFLLVGNANEKQIRQVGSKLEQFRAALARLFGRNELDSHVPTTVIIFKSHYSYQPFKPKPNTAGFFQSNSHINYITLTTELQGEQDPFTVVFHEYTHLLVNSINANMPIWFDEGLAEYYSTMDITGDRRVVLGRPIARHVARLHEAQLLPLKTLFEVDRKSPYYNEEHKQGVFYAQSWALMHYLMSGREGQLKTQLAKFVDLLAANTPSETAFEKTFPVTFATMETDLRNYIQHDRYPTVTGSLATKIDFEDDMKTFRLSHAEAQAYLGDLLLHGNRNEGEVYLQRALALEPHLPLAHASLGLLRAKQSRPAEARQELERAITLDPDNYLWHYYYAFVLSRTGVAETDMVLGFTPETITLMRQHLQKTFELNPDFREARNLMAFVNLVSGKQLDEAVEILRRSLELAPGRNDLVLILAQIYIRQEDYEAARELLNGVNQSNRDDQAAARVKDLLGQITAIEEALARAREGKEEPLPAAGESSANYVKESSENVIAEDPSVFLRAALRKPESGENQVQGTLMRVDCDDKGFTLLVKVDDKIMSLRTVGFRNLNFRSFSADAGREITCGPRMAGNNVVVTYVPPTEQRTQITGITRSIEFVPSDFKLNDP